MSFPSSSRRWIESFSAKPSTNTEMPCGRSRTLASARARARAQESQLARTGVLQMVVLKVQVHDASVALEAFGKARDQLL